MEQFLSRDPANSLGCAEYEKSGGMMGIRAYGLAALAVVVMWGVTPTASLATGSEYGGIDADGGVPRSYIDDREFPLFYATNESSSTCGGNPSCNIVLSAYMVAASRPDDLGIVADMAGPTDANLPLSPQAAVIALIDVPGTPSTWDYALRTSAVSHPLGEAKGAWVAFWDGTAWKQSSFVGSWTRYSQRWIAVLPWREMGMTTAVMAVQVFDAAGQVDYSPSQYGTPPIPIAALVAGAPGQPRGVTASPGPGRVTLSWTPPVYGGTSAISAYTVEASPGGATCTTTSTSCTVTGLTGGIAHSFVVRATNSGGTGPASDRITSTPTSVALAAPTALKAVYDGKSPNGTAAVTWTRPPGANSMQVRWGLNGAPLSPWKSTSVDIAAVTGLVKGKTTRFEVRGVGASGPGPTASIRLALR